MTRLQLSRAPLVVARPARPSVVKTQAQIGDKVLPLLRSPADILFLGPRVALGALLSTSQNLEQLPADLERLATLATDPRPLELKRDDVLVEVESRVVSFLERGLGVENELVTTVSSLVPDDVKSAMPQELRDALLAPRPPPASADSAGGGAGSNGSPWSPSGSAYAASSNGGSEVKPMATWTITSMDEDDATFPTAAAPLSGLRPVEVEVDSEPPVAAATVAASQAAAELVDIQAAVVAVRGRLTELQANADPSRSALVKLNLIEAAGGLATRLRQREHAAAGASDATVAAAVEEAEALLAEVQTL